MRKSLIVFFLIVILFIPLSCAGDKDPTGTVSVAAAANLGAPMDALRAEFEKAHPGIALEVSFGASGVLTTQIRQGAPFAVFLSADTGFPEKLRAEGLAVTDPKVYARGRLVLFSAKPRDFSAGLGLLESPDIKIISIANPETAPYGAAVREALINAGMFNDLTPKIARAQTVAQVVQQVMGAADAGFIAKSSLFAPKMSEYNKDGVFWIDVDPSLYHPIDQALVILKPGERDVAVKVFYDFIFSTRAREIFEKFGYEAGPDEK